MRKYEILHNVNLNVNCISSFQFKYTKEVNQLLYRLLNKKDRKPDGESPSVKPDPLNGWTYGENGDMEYSVGSNSVTEIEINDIGKNISYTINPMIINKD